MRILTALLSGKGDRLQLKTLRWLLLSAAGLSILGAAPKPLVLMKPAGTESHATIPTHITGTIHEAEGKYLIKDEATHVTVELRGAKLHDFSGKRVELKGVVAEHGTPAHGAAGVLDVAEIKLAAGATTTAAGVSTGIGKGTLATIGSIATAGTAGALYAGKTIGHTDSPASRP